MAALQLLKGTGQEVFAEDVLSGQIQVYLIAAQAVVLAVLFVFAEVTTDINNARTALEQAMTVEAINAAVSGLKAIDPITFNTTTFTALQAIGTPASSDAAREFRARNSIWRHSFPPRTFWSASLHCPMQDRWCI